MFCSTTLPADLDRLSRFTFAGRGCRDPRRERRRPAAVARPAPARPAPPGRLPAAGASAAAPSERAGFRGAGRSATAATPSGAATPPSGRNAGESPARPGDRPPPPARPAEPAFVCRDTAEIERRLGGLRTGEGPGVRSRGMTESVGPLVCERKGEALLVGFNRPEKRNAIDLATTEALHQVLSDHARDRCILVLHSTTPGMFVAGADIGELLARDADDAFMGINVRLFERLEAHRWPTIAAVDGPALGGGCELAMACDLRIASTRARFAQPELNLGILAGAGGNWRLPQLVGLPTARRMLYLGETLDAAAALDAGLVDAVHEPDGLLDAALDMAAAIAARSWRALELTKLALRLHRPSTTTFDVAAQSLLFESDDKRERMEGFLNRRKR